MCKILMVISLVEKQQIPEFYSLSSFGLIHCQDTKDSQNQNNMKSIALFFLCLFITISGNPSRLLSDPCAGNCDIDTCYQCDLITGLCQYVVGCSYSFCLTDTQCPATQTCQNNQCVATPPQDITIAASRARAGCCTICRSWCTCCYA
eukprot:11506_1